MSGPLVSLSIEDRAIMLSTIIDGPVVLMDGTCSINQRTTRTIQNRIRNYPRYITALKPPITKLRPFIVADIETLLYKGENDEVETQYPYSTGFLMVRPGEPLNKRRIEIYYSEDYKMIMMDHFPKRSTKLLVDMIRRISTVVKRERKVLTIYLHNFARFDGVFLFRHLACHHKNYEYKGLMRNHRLYEIAVYSKGQSKRLLFRFRDSLHLLPGKLASLANNLCQELGVKGSIDHDMVSVNNLESNKDENIKYLKQDILLLGGIMLKAQEI